jgi:hypothetical protein
MSSSAVYCPKCGTPSTDGARFCRRCGTNLEAVSQALTGQLAQPRNMDDLATEMEVAYAKEYSKAIYNLIGSITTFLVLLFIFRGSFWVYFLLLWVANCVRDVIQANLLKRQITNPIAFQAALSAYKDDHGKRKKKKKHEELPPAPVAAEIPSAVASGEYVPPVRNTGELFDPDNPPPSVTEGTTRHLDQRNSGS